MERDYCLTALMDMCDNTDCVRHVTDEQRAKELQAGITIPVGDFHNPILGIRCEEHYRS